MAKRYQKGNQNSYIEKGQAIQWSKYTKGVIRIRLSRKDKQYNGQKGNQNPYIEKGQAI